VIQSSNYNWVKLDCVVQLSMAGGQPGLTGSRVTISAPVGIEPDPAPIRALHTAVVTVPGTPPRMSDAPPAQVVIEVWLWCTTGTCCPLGMVMVHHGHELSWSYGYGAPRARVVLELWLWCTTGTSWNTANKKRCVQYPSINLVLHIEVKHYEWYMIIL
jgi:hypothetical protein